MRPRPQEHTYVNGRHAADCETCIEQPKQKTVKIVTELKVTPKAIISGGNQAALSNGCVCDSGCEACGRLAEAFASMREALQITVAWYGKTKVIGFPPIQSIRAALALADKVNL